MEHPATAKRGVAGRGPGGGWRAWVRSHGYVQVFAGGVGGDLRPPSHLKKNYGLLQTISLEKRHF